MRRQTIFTLVVIALAGLTSCNLNGSPTDAPKNIANQAVSGFPSFTFDSVLLNPATLNYNPTGEIIFPSIIKASDYFSNPLGTYYMYYAPHDSPGGISLAYANSPKGPWTEYASNPVIANNWQPHYSVSHVSSPHAIWISAENKLFMYFHGENDKTRYASTTNGLNFNYEGVAVKASDFSSISESSYARVFKYTIPTKNNVYIMLLMGNNAGTRKIYLAWSNDARNWTTQATPFISPSANPDEGGQLSSPFYFPWQGKHYVIYHAGTGNQYVAEVGANFDQEIHKGIFYDDPEKRAASPYPITENGVTYLFYERGPRLNAEIALATTSSGGEIVIDNDSSCCVTIYGDWTPSTGAAGYLGNNYLHDGAVGDTEAVKYAPSLSVTASYTVYARWTSNPNRSSNVQYRVKHQGSSSYVYKDQRSNGGTWQSLGTYTFNANQPDVNWVAVKSEGSNGYVVADAIKFVKQ